MGPIVSVMKFTWSEKLALEFALSIAWGPFHADQSFKPGNGIVNG